MRARTGAERYFRRRLGDADYAAAYRAARDKIDRVDALVRAIESRRQELGLTKAELARRAGLKPEAIRRLLTANEPNPTLATLLSIAKALESSLAFLPSAASRNAGRAASSGQSSAKTVRRRLNSSPKRRASA